MYSAINKSGSMKELIFATHNKNKVKEIDQILNGSFLLKSLAEIHFTEDIPEPFDTIEENAVEKARVIFEKFNADCFSEDTGLEVTALNGAPGVRSARYAGNHDFEANIDLLLHNMKHQTDRTARFKTVICLIQQGKMHLFEGICAGKIIEKRKGANGFGYDPIFVPDGSSKTFAEMSMEEKNVFSHRKKAMKKLITFLKQAES